MTRIEIRKCLITGDLVFNGRITQEDMSLANFDAWDLAVINSPARGMADYLQSLEIIAFRIEQGLK